MRAASRSAAVSVTVAWAQGTWAQAVPAHPLACGQPDQFIRKKGSSKTKVEVRDKLRDLHKELDAGLRPRRRYAVGEALEDWLAHGAGGLWARAVAVCRA